jgi:tRNA(fMet)-specific endonuclease VapC
MSFLIDTDIIIENLKQNEAVRKRLIEYATIPKAISVITYGELLYGAQISRQSAKNLATIRGLPDIFPIINVGRGIMETFIETKRTLELEGQALDDMDLLIAATALTLNYRLVTNNTKHFGRVKGLEIDNWLE